MKQLLILILSLYVSLQLNAQTLQVKVVDSKGATLPFASVYINQTPSCITDLNGIAVIPFEKLNYGDTIISTYIGMKTSSVIYTKKVHNLSKCTITLDEGRIYELNAVVVKAIDKDAWKLFNKNVITHNSLIFTSCIINGKFKADVLLFQEKTPRNIMGTFILSNETPPKIPLDNFFRYNILESPILTTTEQSQDIIRITVPAINYAVSFFCKTVSRINWDHKNPTINSGISYLGLNKNSHYFRLIHIDNLYNKIKAKQSYSFQILFSVNKDTQEIETIESFIPSGPSGLMSDSRNMVSIISKKLLYKKEGKELVITVPAEIEYKWSGHIHLILSDINVQMVNK